MTRSWIKPGRARWLAALSTVALAWCPLSGGAQEATPAPAQNAAASAPAGAPERTAGDTRGARESAKIAWYGKKFTGRTTASGKPYNPHAMTMAHKSLPFGTKVRVTNPANGNSVVLRVTDRGPTQGDRAGDVSYAAARKLGMLRSGVIDAELEVVAAAK